MTTETILKFERRRSERNPWDETGTAAFIVDGCPVKLTSVEIIDRSEDGLGALSPVPISPGASFAIRPDGQHVTSHSGTVVRCEPLGKKYRLGLMCRPQAMAA